MTSDLPDVYTEATMSLSAVKSLSSECKICSRHKISLKGQDESDCCWLSTKSGKQLKLIQVVGEGVFSPFNGDTVNIHFSSFLDDGSVLDGSSYRGGGQYLFKIGKGYVADEVETLIKSMRINECSILYCKASQILQNPSCPVNLRTDSKMVVQVHLLSFFGKDVTEDKDGGVRKSIIKPAVLRADHDMTEEDKPNDGAKVKVNLSGFFPNKESRRYEQFDDRTVEFHVGEDNQDEDLTTAVVDGVDLAVRKMKLGEVARVMIDPEYGYGSEGCLHFSIPPHTPLVYSLQLLSFIQAPPVWKVDSSRRLELAQSAKEKGTFAFKKGRVKKAIRWYEKVIDLIENDAQFTKPSSEEEAADQLRTRQQDLILASNLNLALCHEKLGHFSLVISHCSTVLNSPTAAGPGRDNTKALYRRANAYMSTREYLLASEDFHHLSSLERTNKTFQRLYQHSLDLLHKQTKEREKTYFGMFDKFAEEDSQKSKVDPRLPDVFDYANDWQNKLAAGMLPLEMEQQAFADYSDVEHAAAAPRTAGVPPAAAAAVVSDSSSDNGDIADSRRG